MVIILSLVIIVIIILCFLLKPKVTLFKSLLIDKPIPYTFYWINLDKAKERRDKLITNFNLYKIKNKRVDAILGGPKHRDKEIACLRSHIKAIQTFYDSNDDVGIICEDDLSFEYKPYWRENLKDVIENAPEKWQVIQLGVTPLLLPSLMLWYSNFNYINYHPWCCGIFCYAINRQGAHKILTSKQPIPSIIEHFIYLQAKTYIYKYPMFTYPNDNDSFIHSDHLSYHSLAKSRITNYLKYDY